MGSLNLWFSATYAVIFLAGITVELIGVFRRGKGDTITENWRWIDKWLAYHSPIIDWFWRVFSAGALVWILLHLLPRV